MNQATTPAVQIRNLSRSFRGKVALKDVSLQIPVGSIFGLVGLNGAGKTTLIRHLIGSLKAAGWNPVRNPHGRRLTEDEVGALLSEHNVEALLGEWNLIRQPSILDANVNASAGVVDRLLG